MPAVEEAVEEADDGSAEEADDARKKHLTFACLIASCIYKRELMKDELTQ